MSSDIIDIDKAKSYLADPINLKNDREYRLYLSIVAHKDPLFINEFISEHKYPSQEKSATVLSCIISHSGGLIKYRPFSMFLHRSLYYSHDSKKVREIISNINSFNQLIKPFEFDYIQNGINSEESLINEIDFDKLRKLVTSFHKLKTLCCYAKNPYVNGSVLSYLLASKMHMYIFSSSNFKELYDLNPTMFIKFLCKRSDLLKAAAIKYTKKDGNGCIQEIIDTIENHLMECLLDGSMTKRSLNYKKCKKIIKLFEIIGI